MTRETGHEPAYPAAHCRRARFERRHGGLQHPRPRGGGFLHERRRGAVAGDQPAPGAAPERTHAGSVPHDQRLQRGLRGNAHGEPCESERSELVAHATRAGHGRDPAHQAPRLLRIEQADGSLGVGRGVSANGQRARDDRRHPERAHHHGRAAG